MALFNTQEKIVGVALPQRGGHQNRGFKNNSSVQMSSAAGHGAVPHHGYHLVDPSPWPALTRFSIMWTMISLVLYFHQYAGAGTLALVAILCVAYTASVWWRDVHREGL